MTLPQSSPATYSKPKLQLRIDFDSTPSRPTVLEVELVGTRVHVDVASGLVEDAWGYLISAGIDARVEAHSPILFDAVQLNRLTLLPNQVTVIPIGTIKSLFELVSYPPPPEFPVTLYTHDGFIMLRWFDGSTDHNTSLHPKAIPAFLTLQVAFVADNAAWEALMGSSEIRPVVGRVRLNYEGFCEIDALTPQMVESAPIPALFRIDDTHFGFPAMFANQVLNLKGFQWQGRLPRITPLPELSTNLSLLLRPHLMEAVPTLAKSLTDHGGHLLAWDPNLGRRLGALAAVDTLGAYPLVIVTTPWRVWLWQRQLEELGKPSSTFNTSADVQITTYHDLALRKDSLRPVAAIFDDIDHPQALGSAVKNSLTALVRTYPDMYRLGILTKHPNEDTLTTILNIIRPGEFDSTLPLPRRYPGDFQLQLQRHMECYMSVPDASFEIASFAETELPFAQLTRATVEVTSPSSSQLEAIHNLRTLSSVNSIQRLDEVLEIVSVGTNYDVSPKIARAVTFINNELDKGHNVAVAVAHSSTITILKATLAARHVYVADQDLDTNLTHPMNGKETPLVLLVNHKLTQPNLSTFDAVLVLDYPWSLTLLDRMLEAPPLGHVPSVLKIIHLAGTPDDRLALFAAMRREAVAPFTDLNVPPTLKEAMHLLAFRHTQDLQDPHFTANSQLEGASHILS